MKTRMLCGVGVLGVVAYLAGAVYALPFPADTTIEVQFRDASSLYDENGVPRPVVPGITPAVGDEDRSIGLISNIADVTVDPPLVSFTNGQDGREGSFMLYDLRLASVTPLGTQLVLDFLPLNRNPLASDISPTLGGVLRVFDNPAGSFAFNPDLGDSGPVDWVEGQGIPSPDLFPGITGVPGGFLSLEGNFVPLDTPGLLLGPLPGGGLVTPGAVFREVIDLGTGTGQFTAVFHILGGTQAGEFARNTYGPGADMLIQGTLVFLPNVGTPGRALPYTDGSDGQAGWQVASNDPVRAVTVVPEPMTTSMTVLALAGLGLYLKKARRSAN